MKKCIYVCARMFVSLLIVLTLSRCAFDKQNEVVDKDIISAQWTTSDFSHEITNVSSEENVGILIKTRNYKQGEIVSLVINENLDGIVRRSWAVSGVVDAEGNARASIHIDNEHEGSRQENITSGREIVSNNAWQDDFPPTPDINKQ